MSFSVEPANLSFPLQSRVPLAPMTTFGIGGQARWFAAVTTEQQLAEACAWAARQQLPLFILGGGSNVLVADSGFPGLVVRIDLRGVRRHNSGDKQIFDVAAGESWDDLVHRSVEDDCAGIECLAGIPGTVGGTPVQNVGAYGQEVAQTIIAVRCYDRTAGSFLAFTAAECGFAYRSSRFNSGTERGRYIVTHVQFALRPGGAPCLVYADLARRFASDPHPSLAATAEAVRAIRRAKGMVIEGASLAERDPDTRSAGSFFKNPVVAPALYQQIVDAASPETVPSYPAPDGHRKLPAAWLMEQAGFGRGFTLGGAALSSKHPLALTNRSGHASAAEIVALRDLVIAGVRARFAVVLEPEPVFVGEAPPQALTGAQLP